MTATHGYHDCNSYHSNNPTILHNIKFSQVYGKNDEMPTSVNEDRNEELILDIQAYRSKLTETYTGDE